MFDPQAESPEQSPDLGDQLTALAVDSTRSTDLARTLQDLLHAAARAAPSILAVSLTHTRLGMPVTVTALAPAALLDRARCSLTVPVPWPGSTDAQLVVFAASAGALSGLADSLRAALGPFVLLSEGELALPALSAVDLLAGQLPDLSAVDRAVGVLLDRGMLPHEGRRHLQRQAARQDCTMPQAAGHLLAQVATRIPRPVAAAPLTATRGLTSRHPAG